jgi:uncharacterized protein YjbI with pentapeptide repeats
MSKNFIPGYVYLDSNTNIFYFLVKIDYININNTIITPSENNNITKYFNNHLNHNYNHSKLFSKNFFNEISLSLTNCFGLNENTVDVILSNPNYTNYILLSSETIFNNSQMLGFISVEHNIKINNYSFVEEETNNNTPINYIWNVCKNIEYNNYKNICSIMINLITKNPCNNYPFILDVLNNNDGAKFCYQKSGFVNLQNIIPHPDNDKFFMMYTNKNLKSFKEDDETNTIVLANNIHSYTLIAHGITKNNFQNIIRNNDFNLKEIDFPFHKINFFANEGELLGFPTCSINNDTVYENLPGNICFKNIETVEDIVSEEMHKINITPMVFSTNDDDDDIIKDSIGLYYCNSQEKILDWDDINDYDLLEVPFTFELLFNTINEHANNNKINKDNIQINIYACRGYCNVMYQPTIIHKGGSTTNMSQEQLFNWLETCDIPMKGGAETVFDKEIENNELKNFESSDENIQNKNNIDSIKIIDGTFSNSYISNCNFYNCELENIIFQLETKLNTIKFHECTFKNITIHNCSLQNVDFINCTVYNDEINPGFNVYNSSLDFCDLHNIDLNYCKFIEGEIINSDFRGANLSNAIFEDVDLTGMIFDETTILTNTTFRNVTGLNTNDSDISRASFDDSILIPNFNNSPTNIIANLSDDDLSEVSTVATDILDAPNNLSMDDDSDWINSFEPQSLDGPPPLELEDLLTDNDLLIREPVDIKQYTYQKFDNLEQFDLIEQENVNYCNYIREDPNNLIFLYDEQTCFITKDLLRKYISTDIDNDKIVFICKERQDAYVPRRQNIYEVPQLNMDIFGLFGVMVPLQELDSILNNDYQIYVIQTNYYSQPVPIASLNTRLGGNVVSANFCQALVAIKSGYISYVKNEVLFNKCSEQGNN